ncbi:MAG: transposase [Oceanicoccus sp.]|uniref:DDE-type integrase/transposase/recombinase n=1 Tax=Oceanicoccus sp. TaxID=2691044 RepID=UPI002618B4DD|nr:DDE-type integrase/transposase/recombinase [Oceanicoccus sp.]MCP3906492.1 transposase [Oceanicoccus sp.]
MNGKTKSERHQERKAKKRKEGKRKAKLHKNRVLAYRRQIDRARRARRRREQREHTKKRQRKFKFRVKVVRYFQWLREMGVPEKKAVEMTYEKYRPREQWHLPLSFSTIRNWVRQVKRAKGHYQVLRPKSCRPKQITYQVPVKVIGIIFTWRHQLGWGGHRIAAELKRRKIASISGRTVYKIFDRLGLPVKPYALKGKSAGIAYRRYQKTRPNIQWHMDLKQTKLTDGTIVYICIVIDDHSRYVLLALVGLEKTATFTAQAVKNAVTKAGQPLEIMTDNGREFSSPWEESLTQFGRQLAQLNIAHLTSPPYYPQANGKAEAFIKTINRELLSRHSFATVEELQLAVDQFLIYYNNYRGHSSLGWQAPVTRFAGRAVIVRGLAAIPGLEPMAADPQWGPAYCDPPVTITPTTVPNRNALVPLMA